LAPWRRRHQERKRWKKWKGEGEGGKGVTLCESATKETLRASAVPGKEYRKNKKGTSRRKLKKTYESLFKKNIKKKNNPQAREREMMKK